jgi:hypothetical protein
MILPNINLNGTSVNELLRAQYSMVKALDKALDTLGEIAPHGRDYLDSGTYEDARAQFERERAALLSLRKYHMEKYQALFDASQELERLKAQYRKV